MVHQKNQKLDSFQYYILDQLHSLPGLTCRSMFGGYGMYQGATFFGILHNNRLYFKTNERTSQSYKQRGMESFKPNEKQHLKNYFEVPIEVMEDPVLLTEWARTAVQVGKEKRGFRGMLLQRGQ